MRRENVETVVAPLALSQVYAALAQKIVCFRRVGCLVHDFVQAQSLEHWEGSALGPSRDDDGLPNTHLKHGLPWLFGIDEDLSGLGATFERRCDPSGDFSGSRLECSS